MKKEISAEMLLDYLYPEKTDQWEVETKGTFYRNYNQDAMEVNLQRNSVTLARDGIMRLLPEGIFVTEESKKTESREQETWRLMLLNEAFIPFDTLGFRSCLQTEKVISGILDEKWTFIISEVFGYSAQDTAYMEMVGFIPLIRNRKGDFQLIKRLLATLCKCPVTMDMSHRFSHSDSTRKWVPMVRYELLVDDLTSDEYASLSEKMHPLKNFIQEWMVPFDVRCEIAIKQHGCEQVPGENLILDYNSEL